ncbi:MAG: FHA domain-containing protein [Anaerolineales bacterium]|nr:FHA domain-containing protein [Anaerolineales bacterium]
MTSATALFLVRILLVLALYSFIAFSLMILWKDTRNKPSEDQYPIEARLFDDETAMDFALAAENSIGRAVDNSICLSDETVSAYHARISYPHQQWILEDLESRNGTHVNGIPVDGSLVITYGDVIEFGKVILTFAHQSTPSTQEAE